MKTEERGRWGGGVEVGVQEKDKKTSIQTCFGTETGRRPGPPTPLTCRSGFRIPWVLRNKRSKGVAKGPGDPGSSTSVDLTGQPLPSISPTRRRVYS